MNGVASSAIQPPPLPRRRYWVPLAVGAAVMVTCALAWLLLAGGHVFPGAESSYPVTMWIRGRTTLFDNRYPYSLDMRITAPPGAIVTVRSLALADSERLRHDCIPAIGLQTESASHERQMAGGMTVFDAAAELHIPNCIRGRKPLTVSGEYTILAPQSTRSGSTNTFSMTFAPAYALWPLINPERTKRREAEKTSQFMLDYLLQRAQ